MSLYYGNKHSDFIPRFLAMAMPKQVWHCSHGLTKTFERVINPRVGLGNDSCGDEFIIERIENRFSFFINQ